MKQNMISDKEVYDYLASHEVKGSVQRIAVMRYLLEHHTHPTVDEIFTELHEDIPTLSKTTVYNTLKLLVEQGAAMMLTIDDKNAHYDAVKESHAHFFCYNCGKIIDIYNPDGLGDYEHKLPDGCKLLGIQLYYTGLCPKCASKTKN